MVLQREFQVNHTDRKVIEVKKDNFQLLVSVGEIIITIRYEELDLFMKKLENSTR